MRNQDVSWQQRFESFVISYELLQEAVDTHDGRGLNQLEQQGLIHRFECTHELAWRLLKAYLEDQGIVDMAGPKDVSHEALASGLVEDGDCWVEMIESRSQAIQTYEDAIVDELQHRIVYSYCGLYLALKNKMETFV